MAFNILIIEDDSRVADYLKELLVGSGYEVMAVTDAVMGFELADRVKPDLVLLDLMLPLGGGFTTLQKLRVSARTKMIPVIVVSAIKEEKEKRQAKSLGVKAYLYKPIDSALLLSKIKEALPAKK